MHQFKKRGSYSFTAPSYIKHILNIIYIININNAKERHIRLEDVNIYLYEAREP